MKKVFAGAGILAAVLLQNCSTDFDLNTDYQETPVIFALLNASSSTQYIRINRTFLNDTVDAFTLAQDPTQIYYGDELQAHIEEYNGLTYVASYPLERVDGDTLGLPKQEGLFANMPNILYRLDVPLQPSYNYKVVAQNTESGKYVSAQTDVVDSFASIRPNDGSIFPQNFSVVPGGTYQLQWKAAQDAVFYELTLRFHYREGIYSESGDSIQFTGGGTLDWVFNKSFVSSVTAGTTLSYDVDGTTFFSFIRDNFPPVDNPDYIRVADSVQFIIDAGGEALYNYYLFNNSSLGITEGEVLDAYTNVNGGLGIVSSRYHRIGKTYPFSIQTRDSIACGTLTQGHNFAPDASHPGYPFCSN